MEELKLLAPGSKAPDFELPDSKGEPFRLYSLFPEFHVVLYFYPKDMTPGCTREAEGFRDLYDEFRKLRTEVIGVSTDSVRSHQRFVEKLGIPFPLLSDQEKKVVKLYGVYGPKKRFGKLSWGTHRITYVIDNSGIIRKVYDKVDTGTHAEEVLEWIKSNLAGK